MTKQEKEHYTKLAEHYNSDRDCNSCINHTEKGCSAWECEYISREQALRAVETLAKIKADVIIARKYYTDGVVDLDDFLAIIDKALGEVGEQDG